MSKLSPWARLQHSLRAWRRSFKAHMPYVRRREYRKARAAADQLASELLTTPDMAASARMDTIVLRAPSAREVCLFVSYAAHPVVKHHVRQHIRAFHAAGFDVLFVLNSPHAAQDFTFDDDLTGLCRGVFVRENKGFDFGAWAHLAQVIDLGETVERIVLVNDSILGPLDTAAFQRMIERIRRSPADLLGLTRSLAVRPHLQSFFLVFQHAALNRGLFTSAMQAVRNFQTKEVVIDLYETHLTRHMEARGLRCESVFPLLSEDIHSSNDTYFRWDELIRHGFPYVKISLLSEKRTLPTLRAAIPADLLNAWELEQQAR
jgi:lipopolysaccharide biosynthesis protein